jgi:hypothetical protein
MYLLFVTGSYASFYFLRCTEVAVNLLVDQDRLDGCITKDDAGCEEAVNHSDYNLHWLKEKSVRGFLLKERRGGDRNILTNSLSIRNLKSANWLLALWYDGRIP